MDRSYDRVMIRLALLLSFATNLLACADCPLIGCGPAVEIAIGSEDDPIDGASEFRIDLDLDGESHRVTCQIDGLCEDERSGYDFRVEALRSTHAIDVEIFGSDELAPEMIETYVLAGNSQIHEGLISPTYEDRDKGDHDRCGVCRRADMAYELPGS